MPANPSDVKQQAENWQRCRPDVLPSLFFAFDEGESQTERVVSFQLSASDLNALKGAVKVDANGKPEAGFRFVVHLGLDKDRQTPEIPTSPAFSVFFQAHNKSDGAYDNCFQLSWRRNSQFDQSMERDSSSGVNAIPPAEAYTFITQWLEVADKSLAEPFTGVSPVLGRRVGSYISSKAISASIYESILISLQSNSPGLDVHCGVGAVNTEHPFSFRPVIELMNSKAPGEETITTGLAAGNSGSTYYDYGYPDPPGEPDDGV